MSDRAETSTRTRGFTGPGPYGWVLLTFGVLLLVRWLGAYNVYFLEEDEISLAAGIAALVRDNVGELYRYTPQLGYHRFVEWATLLLGGDIALVPRLMKLWSVIVGALVPALGLLMFRNLLSRPERWLLVLVLAINPILWRSSQYGNSAMASLGFVVVALTLLSNPGGPWRRALGLGAFGLAVFVRADAVVMAPLFAYLLYRELGSWRTALGWLGGLAAIGSRAGAVVLATDPRLDGAASALANHMMNAEWTTQFWEYLLWAMSPLPLVFAVLGLRALAADRHVLFWT
ncbi:MAG: hypothetical protein R3266_01290, partial [Gemmatimonadota bacterium]|nr:hypothetical protein [Gemmatimonadota bacterium]